MMWSIAALHSAQVDQRGHHLVLRFDGLRIGLVGALGGHHVDQFGRQVDVGVLQRARAQGAEVAVAGRAHHGRAAGGGGPPSGGCPPPPAPPRAGGGRWGASWLLLPRGGGCWVLGMRDSASWPSERVTPLE